MRLRQLGLEPQGLVIRIDGLLLLSEFSEDGTQIVVRVGIVRLETYRFLIVSQRICGSLYLFKKSAEIIMRNVILRRDLQGMIPKDLSIPPVLNLYPSSRRAD